MSGFLGALGGGGGGVIGGAVVRLAVDSTGLTTGLKKAEAATASSAKTIGGGADTMSSKFQAMGPIIVAAAAAAGAALFKLGSASVKAFMDAQESVDQFNHVLETSPQLAGETADAFIQQAEALQQLIGADDEAVLAADAVLARFELTGSEIRQVIPLVADLAVVLGKDIPGAAEDVGKALLGNAKALKNVGIMYKATGDRTADLINLMAILQEKVGGAAEAVNPLELAVRRMNQAWEETQETIGAELAPVLADLAEQGAELAKDIGPALAQIFALVAETISIAADEIAPFVSQIGDLLALLPETTTQTGEAAESTSSFANTLAVLGKINPLVWLHKYNEAVFGLIPGLNGAEDAQSAFTRSVAEAREGVANTAGGFDEIAAAAAAWESHLEVLRDLTAQYNDTLREQQQIQLQLAGGELGLISAAQQHEDALHDLNEAQKDSTTTQAEMRAAQAEVVSSYISLREQALALRDDMFAQGATQEQVRDSLYAIAIQAGLTQKQAAALADEAANLNATFGATPGSVKTNVTAPGLATNLSLAQAYQQALNALDAASSDVHIAVVTEYSTIGHGVTINEAGGVRAYAKGGVRYADAGMISNGPTTIFGEGNYSTRFGKGGEMYLPLDDRTLRRFWQAAFDANADRQGGGQWKGGDGGMETIVLKIDSEELARVYRRREALRA